MCDRGRAKRALRWSGGTSRCSARPRRRYTSSFHNISYANGLEDPPLMATETELIDLLVAAQRASQSTVDATLFADIDRAAAYRIQAGVLAALGETPALIKTAVQPGDVGIAAPIFASRFGQSGDFSLPIATVT